MMKRAFVIIIFLLFLGTAIFPNILGFETINDPTYKSIKLLMTQPPNPPTINGPTTVYMGVYILFEFNCIDPDNDNIYLYIDWGDESNTGWIGPYESGEVIREVHMWDETGDFTISAKAKDTNGSESDWSYHIITVISHPPDPPTIDGPDSGAANVPYLFTFTSTDNDGDDVRFIIDWGDGKTDTTTFTASGNDKTVLHTWTEKATYVITAYAEDIHGGKSDNSTYQIIINKNKAINCLFLQLFQGHLRLFGIIQIMLSRLGF